LLTSLIRSVYHLKDPLCCSNNPDYRLSPCSTVDGETIRTLFELVGKSLANALIRICLSVLSPEADTASRLGAEYRS